MLRENHLEELNFGFPCILEISILAIVILVISNLAIVKILLHLPYDEKNLLLHYDVIKTYLGSVVGLDWGQTGARLGLDWGFNCLKNIFHSFLVVC